MQSTGKFVLTKAVLFPERENEAGEDHSPSIKSCCSLSNFSFSAMSLCREHNLIFSILYLGICYCSCLSCFLFISQKCLHLLSRTQALKLRAALTPTKQRGCHQPTSQRQGSHQTSPENSHSHSSRHCHSQLSLPPPYQASLPVEQSWYEKLFPALAIHIFMH